MTVTCNHCGQMFNEVPIVGDPQGGWKNLLTDLTHHTFQRHKKEHEELMKKTLAKLAVIEGTFLALTGMGQYSSADPEWAQKKQAGFDEAYKLVEEFRPCSGQQQDSLKSSS